MIRPSTPFSYSSYIFSFLPGYNDLILKAPFATVVQPALLDRALEYWLVVLVVVVVATVPTR